MGLHEDITRARVGSEHDPAWQKYHQWRWGHFPIRLPGCTVTCNQEARPDALELASIGFCCERGVPLVIRLDDHVGRILFEVPPEMPLASRNDAERETIDGDFAQHRIALTAGQLGHQVGFGFEWVFDLPLVASGEYQPHKPLGVVLLDSSLIMGFETIITVSALTDADL